MAVTICIWEDNRRLLPRVINHSMADDTGHAAHNIYTSFIYLRYNYTLHTLHPFNGLFYRTIWGSQHQKGKPFWILLAQEMMGWQWHQLDHMRTICTLLAHHASTSPLKDDMQRFFGC